MHAFGTRFCHTEDKSSMTAVHGRQQLEVTGSWWTSCSTVQGAVVVLDKQGGGSSRNGAS